MSIIVRPAPSKELSFHVDGAAVLFTATCLDNLFVLKRFDLNRLHDVVVIAPADAVVP